MHIVGDFLFGSKDETCNIFVYSQGGQLSGIEISALGEARRRRENSRASRAERIYSRVIPTRNGATHLRVDAESG